MKLWNKIILLLLIPQLCYAQTILQSRDIKQPAETKLFISSNSPLIKDYATAKAITVNGNTTISTAQIKTGKNSIYFDGTNDYLALNTSTDWAFGTGDFTFDMYFNCGAKTTVYTLVSGTTDDAQLTRIFLRNDNNIRILIGVGFQDFAYTWAAGTWYHLACVRSSGVIKMFINGTQIGSDYNNANNAAFSGEFKIGTYYDGSYDYIGYLSDVRITKGKALWTSNFTPPRRSGAY